MNSSSDEDDDILEKLNIMNVGSKRKPKVDYKAQLQKEQEELNRMNILDIVKKNEELIETEAKK